MPLGGIPPKKGPSGPRSDFFQLDKFSKADVERWKEYRDEVLRYHWDYYSALAFQRGKIAEDIRLTVLGAAKGALELKGWQRAVKYKYSLEPLSPVGSLKDAGGRFNIPDLHPGHFKPFPALYVCADKMTALAEVLGQPGKGSVDLSAEELALTNPGSVALLAVSVRVDSVIDLREIGKLEPLIRQIRRFSVPEHLRKMARRLKLPNPDVVRGLGELKRALMEADWRRMPMQYDVPATCQLFGEIVASAGIEAIYYPSKLTGRECLAVFPQNLAGESFVELQDETPPGIGVRRLDAGNWSQSKAEFGID